MWHIDKPTQQTLDDYAKTLLPGLIKRIDKSIDLPQNVKDVLIKTNADGTRDESVLRGLLLKEPHDLFALSESLMPMIIAGYDVAELSAVSIAMKTPQRDAAQKVLKAKYALLKKLEDVFGYNVALSQNKSRSYKLAAEANHNTCVYCNRQYAFNIVRGKGKNDGDRIARPALDHWFPKSLFPLMSLSYYNLIPSCTVCNSSAKLDSIWMLSTHIHPYLTKKAEPDFKFRYKAGLNSTWDIDFENLTGREKNTVNDLCLREAYQAHSSLEVADLIEMATKNNGTYLKQVYDTILGLYASGTDKVKAYRLLFGSEMMPLAYKNRPMSKLKRDIIEQIEKAKGVKFFE